MSKPEQPTAPAVVLVVTERGVASAHFRCFSWEQERASIALFGRIAGHVDRLNEELAATVA